MPAKVLERGGADKGTKTCLVQCECGTRNNFYVWSWSGHGKARCYHCRRWIGYKDLKVFDLDDGSYIRKDA